MKPSNLKPSWMLRSVVASLNITCAMGQQASTVEWDEENPTGNWSDTFWFDVATEMTRSPVAGDLVGELNLFEDGGLTPAVPTVSGRDGDSEGADWNITSNNLSSNTATIVMTDEPITDHIYKSSLSLLGCAAISTDPSPVTTDANGDATFTVDANEDSGFYIFEDTPPP